MKVYINRQPISGPWGGGNRTVVSLVEQLNAKGHQVVYTLKDSDIDLLFCFDPRPNNFGEDFRHIYQYKSIHNSKVVQRIGDLGLHSKPQLTQILEYSVPHADLALFISDYAMNYLRERCILPPESHVVNLAPPATFFNNRRHNEDTSPVAKIVTHHWSTNPKKGFDYYQLLDGLLKDINCEFTYIGRKPDSVHFSNINYMKPMNAIELIQELPKHDIYLTASVEETGGNHVLEAMACGLPVVYHQNGCGIVDYCHKYGEQYADAESMIATILKVINNYSIYKNAVMSYENTLETMISAYIDLMENEFEKLQSEYKH
jgi:glycosyltransferase involved in cell wall biosynthesis|tara:strand:- start:17821 stop:18771 length:951 start_codon:yes stop_codon:yes gene_type:complete